MRGFKRPPVIYFFWVLSPFLLLIKAILARVAGLSCQFSHITQSNLALTVDSTKTDNVLSFLYVFQPVSNSSVNSKLSESDINLSGKEFLQRHLQRSTMDLFESHGN